MIITEILIAVAVLIFAILQLRRWAYERGYQKGYELGRAQGIIEGDYPRFVMEMEVEEERRKIGLGEVR